MQVPAATRTRPIASSILYAVNDYCRKPTNIRGCSAPPAVRLACTIIYPSALTLPVCRLQFEPVVRVNTEKTSGFTASSFR